MKTNYHLGQQKPIPLFWIIAHKVFPRWVCGRLIERIIGISFGVHGWNSELSKRGF